MTDEAYDEAYVRQVLAKMLVLGHAEYHPDDMHLPSDERRMRLTPAGEVARDRLLNQMQNPPV